MALIGVGLTSTTAIIQTNDKNAWMGVQENFNIPLRQAVKRIRSFYELAISETMINAQINMNHELKNDCYKTGTLLDIIENTKDFLTL